MINKKQYDDGVYQISSAEYHASKGISRSQLFLMNKSRYHFWYEVLSGEYQRDKTTPAQIIGNAFHTLLLEPHLFNDEYCVKPILEKLPEQLLLKNVGRELFEKSKAERQSAQDNNNLIMDNFEKQSSGKIILSHDQFIMTSEMVKLVSRHDVVSKLLSGSRFENSIYWTDKETGIQFKARPDIWSDKMVVDLKTARDVNTNRFKYACLDGGYYLQAAMIYEACKALDMPFQVFAHLVVEKDKPYVPKVFLMSDDALQYGLDQFYKFKIMLAESLSTDKWDGYAIEELGISDYATKQLDEI